MTQPEALRLADALKMSSNHGIRRAAAAELRRLHAENESLRAALAEPIEPVACSNTFGCQCPKHFASQQLEQRPKRVLTAVWRDRARRAEAQRDALLEALKSTHAMLQATLFIMQDPEARSIAKAQLDKNRAAIKAAEENT